MLAPKKDEFFGIYYFRQAALLILSILFLPLSASITIIVLILGRLHLVRVQRRNVDKKAPRVLVTGVGMSKGLFLARSLHLGGCTVFGADFEKNGSLYCGRFSNAIRRFFQLRNPISEGIDAYISQVVSIVRTEKIDLWISCSGVATAMEDAKLAEVLRERTKCKVFQFDENIISTLDNKLNFMKKTSELNIAKVQWYHLANINGIPGVLKKIEESAKLGLGEKFIIKSVSMDDISRASLPLLSSHNLLDAEQVLQSLDYSSRREWIIQEFVESGEEYCTHALVINGRVRAFTACPSESILMHYQQLDPDSILYEKMLDFTQKYAAGLGNITGHMSFDFLISYRKTESGYTGILVPIECNPRCHTATVLFDGKETDLTDRYLETIYGEQNTAILQAKLDQQYGFYWISHDLILHFLSPIFRLVLGSRDLNWRQEVWQILMLINHVLTWKDPTFAWWDPLPWFVLNHLFWPCELLMCCVNRMKWKQINVSTGKIFKM
ncbi:putative carbamoylphosphate synthase large subunit [Golovinomyces cichoracearum]|uniref:Putative carbamoylphosphate synthase large subunit n=1 Tax=Golovinomyces cichoracearum TaxID=62708 RepID=A0A420IHG7_9PEZI|nr:putative carbamoylphosphate synthase large subunit [Golovinomyces cichoracearum]